MDTPYYESPLNEEMNSFQNDESSSTVTKRYAGFWMRFWAYIIDAFVIFSIHGLLLSPLKFINEGVAIQFGYWTVNGLLAAIIYYAYFLLMTKFFSQTLGKMVIGLKVIHKDDQPLRWRDLIFREVVGRLIYNIIGFLKLLYIIVAFTDEKQGIHDIVGNTRVVHLE